MQPTYSCLFQNDRKRKVFVASNSTYWSTIRVAVMIKVVITSLSTQMEICQTGYYTEDFRTQEVPAGFDFASYGEFRGSPDDASCVICRHHVSDGGVRCKLLVTSCSDRHKQRVWCFFESLCDLLPPSLSSWRTEEIFAQTVSSHLSMRPWHPGTLAQTQGLRQGNVGLLCVCMYVCVCVCVCE